MPMALVMAELQRALDPERVGRLADDPEFLQRLGEEDGLLDAVQRVVELPEQGRAYLEDIPVALREALRAAVRTAVSDGKAVQLQYSPGYDFEVRMWDYGGAVSVHLSGPYGARPPTGLT